MAADMALLIIDMQNDVVEKLPLSREIIPGLTEVLEKFRTAGAPVFHIRRSYRADGTDVELPRLEQRLRIDTAMDRRLAARPAALRRHAGRGDHQGALAC